MKPVITLRQLEEQYQAFSRRGMGGRWALSGFDYQLGLSLNQFFEQILVSGPAGAEVAFDSLSDLAERQGEILFFSQAKRTLTRAKLRDAWMEFLDLDRFLESEQPDLRERARYRVVCAVGAAKLQDYEDASELGLEGDDAARWDYVRERYLGWEERVDPRASLVARLWTLVKTPFIFVDSCHGLLLRGLGNNVSSEDIAESLLRNYEGQMDRDLLAGRPLSPHEFRFEVAGEGRVLTGERPTISDLNGGCFMARPALLDLVLERLDATHRIDSTLRGARKLPVIWIGGGSGAGKSALLLQVLRAWVERYDVPAIYLGHFAKEIPETLRRLGSSGGVIAIDDLYAPGVRSPDLWSEVSRLASLVTSVTVLACGPADYFAEFRDLCGREGTLEPMHVDVPPLDHDEGTVYLEWYRGRRGGAASDLPSRNFVIAAFVLERRRRGDASLEEFAARLKQRLEEMGLLTDFRTALAVNRLGLQMPGWFFNGHQDALRRLNDEALIVSTTEAEDRSEVWFHPQVASALYDLWRPPATSREARAEDIRVCFRAVREEPDAASTLLQLLTKKTTRLDENVRRAAATAIWEDLVEDVPPFLKLRLMRECRDAGMGFGLDLTSCVPQAKILGWLQDPGMDSSGWASTLLLFWDSFDEGHRASLDKEAYEWLQWHGDLAQWNLVWQRLWRNSGQDRGRLSNLALPWLQEHPESRGWTFVFQGLVDSGESGPALLVAARAWLEHGEPTAADLAVWAKVQNLGLEPEEGVRLLVVRGSKQRYRYVVGKMLAILQKDAAAFPNAVLDGLKEAQDGDRWPYLFEGLCKAVWWPLSAHRARLSSCGRGWLNDREDKPAWTHVWQSLIEFDPKDTELREKGRAWLTGREYKPGWNYVWRSLLELDPEDTDVREKGRAWLSGREDKPEWSYVWQFLLELDPEDTELCEKGRAWLIGREDKPAWNYVWQCLLKLDPEDIELRESGRVWLGGREGKAEWTHVWQRLLELDPEDPELRKGGRAWLSGHEDKPEWSHVWRLLLGLDSEDSGLREIGCAWLSGRGDRPEWNYVWQRLIEVDTENKGLGAIGRGWLGGREDKPDWAFVFGRLLERDQEDAELHETGCTWLKGREDRLEWNYVWRRLLDLHPEDTGLCETGRAWLSGRGDHPGWTYVWQRLVELHTAELHTKDTELMGAGHAWLRGHKDQPRSNYVWQRLLELDPENILRLLTQRIPPDRRKTIRAWLAGREDKPEWTFAWHRLLELDPEDTELREAGKVWLKGREDQPAWNHVWQHLFKLNSRDPVLRDAGHAWLPGREDRPDWGQLWQRLFELDRKNTALRELGQAWLSGNEDKPEWNYVWQRLVELEPKDKTLREKGRNWLTGREDKPEWSHVWQRLFELDRKNPALRVSGRAWLVGREDRPGWNFIWQRLIDLDPKDISLRTVGRKWLTGREDTPGWNYVWQRLLELNPRDTTIHETGRDWLAGRENKPAWSHIWEKLFDLNPGDQQLRAIGSSWLTTRNSRPEASHVIRRLRSANRPSTR
jgi:hypothetical protein